MDTLPQSYQSSCRTRSRAMIHVRPASQHVVGIPKCATTIPSPKGGGCHIPLQADSPVRLPKSHSKTGTVL